MRTFADEITPLPMCLTVLPDYFLEISHKKSISSPFTTKGILGSEKFSHRNVIFPPNGEFSLNLATLVPCRLPE
jgi:hypothetical protein